MKWTTKVPDKPDHYWLRVFHDNGIVASRRIVEIVQDETTGQLCLGDDLSLLCEITARVEWSDQPIPEPEEA